MVLDGDRNGRNEAQEPKEIAQNKHEGKSFCTMLENLCDTKQQPFYVLQI